MSRNIGDFGKETDQELFQIWTSWRQPTWSQNVRDVLRITYYKIVKQELERRGYDVDLGISMKTR